MPIGLLHGLCRYMTQGTGALLYRCILAIDTEGNPSAISVFLSVTRLLAFAWEYLFYAEPDCQSESIVRGFIHPSIKSAQRTSNALEDCSLALT